MQIIKSLLVIGLCLVLGAPALAQPGGGQGMGAMMYNPKTVTTVKGVLQSPQAMTRVQRMGSWIVKTDQGEIAVRLAPPWYLNQQQVSLNPGAAVEVTGSKQTVDGQTFILAREITVGGKTLKLRNEQGQPLWRSQAPAPPPAK